ncbi:MAG TPA: hypothetical protein VFD67_17510 [Gemmatimonadaceae bacterium]|jgi:hypothetical protein|nr:hypothetical protein [Gemmatimonadaceae bacterium]
MLALLAQLTVMVAGVGEGRAGLGFASHIDPGGTSTHYAHDEAVCAACQVRSLHGVARVPHPPVVPVQPRETLAVLWRESFPDSGIDPHNLSRAPPVLS